MALNRSHSVHGKCARASVGQCIMHMTERNDASQRLSPASGEKVGIVMSWLLSLIVDRHPCRRSPGRGDTWGEQRLHDLPLSWTLANTVHTSSHWATILVHEPSEDTFENSTITNLSLGHGQQDIQANEGVVSWSGEFGGAAWCWQQSSWAWEP